MISIVNYGMGNLQSVKNAISLIGKEAYVAEHPKDLEDSEAIILPGVGAFKDCMRNLNESGFIEPLNREILDKKKPFLGICIGMQILAETGYENGKHQGLGWIKGDAVKLKASAENRNKLPHMGWNDIEFSVKSDLFSGIDNHTDFYFVHSYHLAPAACDVACITSFCRYGTVFASSIQKDNIFGVQFHPEKSQGAGIKLINNFLNTAGRSKPYA